MYGYHLWIVLSESTEESDCGSLERKAGELRSLIGERLTCKPNAEGSVQAVNLSLVFQCSGSANHRGEEHDSLLHVLRHIATELPGSHGLVYWYDDEEPGRDRFDGYRAIVVARGRLQDRFDPFLSPITPHVED
ncbi:Imm7 family immunity protein [Paludisphaera soli]|uniref:Imm7 family immunity protein n=1 Tax=Paludisphaera soli TaxID=2712865 RepID=UPI0013EA0D6E|nr:Imm7 family immunity protein [Paludisphaera soli]